MAVRPMTRIAAVACLLPLFLAGCGGDDDPGDGSMSQGDVQTAERFPSARGKTLDELRRQLGPGPVLGQAVSVLEPGENRFAFGLFDRSHRQIGDAPAALYLAEALPGGELHGPFPARTYSLRVKPAFQSETVTNDPDAAKSIYVSRVRFPSAGAFQVMGVARLDDRLVATEPIGVQVERRSPVPSVGDRAPRIETPTESSVGGNIEEIETRVPPDTMHEVDYADAFRKKPIVVSFATPALCQRRVCGPVVDIAEEVKAEHDGDTVFVHMEIYNDNALEKGLRQQVLAFNLQTEPWLFAIDRKGRVAARLEGAYGKPEVEAAVEAAERG
jgi:hypothetical protein